jgi:tyrosinase
MRGDGSVVLSRWDLFVLWHYVTMSLATGGRGSNRAHGGPVFLPWHRMFLIRLEAALQEVTGDPDFGLPYWDWARDRQLSSQLWRAERLGANRGAVTTGALGALRVRITGRTSPATGGFLEAHQPRPITRAAASDPRSNQLPRKSAVAACLQQRAYDEDPWDVDAAGFRNEVEGWRPSPPGLHNLVHVWIGGDMAPGTSPNDPVFYLNHCNVDRTWEAWMVRFARRTYVPDGTPQNGDSPGHNLDEPMVALLGASLTPAEVLDPSPWYEYDSLLVEQ